MLRKSVSIAVAGDSTYSHGLAVVLISALTNLQRDFTLDIRILNLGISEDVLENIDKALQSSNKAYSLKVFPIDLEIFSEINITNIGLTKAAYLRLLIPQFCPDLSKIIYLDSDMIVMADLSKLFEQDTGSFSTWAVIDTIETLSQIDKDVNLIDYNLNPEANYFNSGLLLMNLERWREDNIAGKALDIAYSKEIRLVHEDQTALNIVLNGNWGVLEKTWNYMIVLNGETPQFASSNAAIIHTPGPIKPWMISPSNSLGIVKTFYKYSKVYQSVVNNSQPYLYYYNQYAFFQRLKYWLLEYHFYPTNENGRG